VLFDTFQTPPDYHSENKFFRSAVLWAWVFILTWVQPLYFPNSDIKGQWAVYIPVCLGIVHCGIVIHLRRKAKIPIETAVAWIAESIPFYVVLWQFLVILRNTHFEALPIIVLPLLLGGQHGLPHSDFRMLWTYEKQFGKLFASIMVIIMVVTLAYIFGSSMFGRIPKSIGGGQPEIVLMKLYGEGEPLVSALGLPTTNGLVGPIALLTQSDNSFVVVPTNGLHFAMTISRTQTNKVYAREIQRALVEALFYQDSSQIAK
jgi:hypothetical protein